MNKGKWMLNRIFAFTLAVMMLLTVPEVAAAAVLDGETENTVVENIEETERLEEVLTAEVIVNDAVKGENVTYEAYELGKAQTAGYNFSFFSNSSSVVSLKAGNYANWIDRVSMPQYGVDLYHTFVEATDNDGILDYLIDDEYVSTSSSLALGSESAGVWANCIPITTIENATQEDLDNVVQVVYAAYSAFDRDYPEVFWLTGYVYILTSTDGNGTVTFYLALEDHLSENCDLRSASYKTANAIKTDISTRNAQVAAIVAEAESLDTKGKIEYFNEWLTEHNEYCTTYPSIPEASYECLSALEGSTGENGPVCEAYARAFKILCDEVDIPCVLVSGYAAAEKGGTGEAHMWNYVQLNSAWYAMDVTWNDPMGGASGAVSGAENTDWSLLGSDTLVATDWTFIESHPAENLVFDGATAFTNGPVLSADAYVYSDFENAEIVNDETVYGYDADTVPTINITLKEGATGEVTYEWSEVVLDQDNELYLMPIEGDVDVTTNALPLGLDVGVYYCQVSYNDEEVYYAYVLVDYKELTPSISGSATKVYDGTASYTGSDLEIMLDGVVNGDVISVTADYAYVDAYAGTNKTINATNIAISGDKAYNYTLTSTTATANVGTISPKDISGAIVSLDKAELTYNGTVQTVTPTVVVDGKTLVAGTDYTVTGNTAKDVKDGVYTVTVTGKGNYTGTAAATYTISYLDVTVTVKYNASTVVADWYNNAVEITADGYTISDTLDGTYSANYLVEAEGVNSGLKLYFKNAAGYITNAKDIETINIDKTAPAFTGANDGIKVSTNIWKEFLNTITFDIFHIATQDVTIAATDNGSGVAKYYYYVDNSGATATKTAEELENVTFTELNGLSLAADGKYVIYAYAVDNAGNKSGYICTNGIVIDKTAPVITDIVEPTVENGNLKDTMVNIVFTSSEAGKKYVLAKEYGETAPTKEQMQLGHPYTLSEGINRFTHGSYEPNTTYTLYWMGVDEAGNTSDIVSVTFTTQKTLPTITANPIITGTYGQAVKDMTLMNGIASVEGTWSISAEATDIPEVGTTNKYVVIFTPADQDTYGSVAVEVTPIVEKKAVTVIIDNATKTFGTDNPTFSFIADDMVGSESLDVLGVTLSTTATKTSDVGVYTITGTANAKNYNVTIVDATLTITKAVAPTVAPISKEYVYGLGSEGNVFINIYDLLPENMGGLVISSSKVDENNIISSLSNGEAEILYVVNNTGNAGDTATITVVAQMKNYEDVTITINVVLVDKLAVEPADGAQVSVSGSLTYGDALSKLTFGEVAFVDGDGNSVAGTIAWDTPNAKLNAGTHDVAWTFTPSNTGKYKVATGTVSVTVEKALPSYTVPTGLTAVYNPTTTLAGISLPTADNGVWTWKDDGIVPTVQNAGYTAVFTPTDSANYKTVEATVTVDVTKATPVVTTAPTAGTIIYGDTLADSALTNGEVNVENSSIVVEGTWAWKDATITPVVADSATTEYEVVFTPNDTANYNTISTKITVVVEKAQWPAIVPADEIAADYDWDVVEKVELPEGWVWADEDADTELEFEVEVTATANYVGTDKDNFVNLTKEITITRNVDAPHIEGDETTMGWEAIADEMADADKEELRVDMNGHSVVSGDALEILREEDKTLVIVFKDEDGKEEYTWTIKGSDVEDGNVKALDMTIELFAKDAADKPAIPEILVKEVTAEAKDHKFLSLAHDGVFGFKATLTINVGTANAGKLATLYYFNEISGELEETENVKLEVTTDGSIVLTFEHASDYVLVMSDKPTESGNGGVTPAPGPATGDGVFGNIYFYIALLLAGGLAGYVGVRKKREEQI